MTANHPASPVSHPAAGGDAAAGERRRAHADYVQDQLQQERTTHDHAEMLRRRAPARIKDAKAARAAHGLAPEPSAQDDNLSHYHAVERMLDERAFYPAHDKRTESPDYARVHHQMTVVDDKHCLVCGVQHSTLGDPEKNVFGAVQMETHHRTIEWALANAIDVAKFNQHIRPGLQREAERRRAQADYAKTPDSYRKFDTLYESEMTAKDMKDWIDHGADNLWVLCDVHHRHKFVGVHAITYPIWGPQDVVDATLIAKEIEAAKSTKSNV